jgi:hypothetical protein
LRSKITPPGYTLRLACGKAMAHILSRGAAAQGIAAEIPQACRRQAEELQRKARFFCPRGRAKKCAQIPLSKNSSFLTPHPHSFIPPFFPP